MAITEALAMTQQTLFADASSPPAAANRFADPRPLAVCGVCGSTDYEDRRIHDGASTMRVCRRCERFMGFPTWHGEQLELRPAPKRRPPR
jgi:hypothetical protein